MSRQNFYEEERDRVLAKVSARLGAHWTPADTELFKLAWSEALSAARVDLARAETVDNLTDGSLMWLRKGTSADIHTLAVRELGLREHTCGLCEKPPAECACEDPRVVGY